MNYTRTYEALGYIVGNGERYIAILPTEMLAGSRGRTIPAWLVVPDEPDDLLRGIYTTKPFVIYGGMFISRGGCGKTFPNQIQIEEVTTEEDTFELFETFDVETMSESEWSSVLSSEENN